MLALTASPALAQAPIPREPATVSAEELVQQAKAGQTIDLDGVTVEGDVDLRRIGVLLRPLRCVDCYFNGGIDASDAIFERSVDLSHSTIAGSLDLTGSLLKEQVIFNATEFLGPVVANSARILEGFSFAHARFHALADFDLVRVKGQATFAGSLFEREASFRGAQFENVNFEQAKLLDSSFGDSVFGERVNFSRTAFFGGAKFDGLQLAGGGTFRAATFYRSPLFNNLSVAHDLIFEGATFKDGGKFYNVVSSGSLSLSEVKVTKGELLINNLVAHDLSMDVDLVVKSVHEPPGSSVRQKLLDQVEKSAQAREALTVANRARFVRLSQDATKKHGVEGLIDGVYRNVLGYLVRPRSPFIAFCLLVFAAGLIRALPEISHFLTGLVDRVHEGRASGLRRLIRTPKEKSSAPGTPPGGFASAPGGPSGGAEPTIGRTPPDRPASVKPSTFGIRNKAHAAGHRLYPILHPFAIACDGWAKSLGAAFGRKPDVVMERRDGPELAHAVVQWTEFLVYKGLIAVFLLTLSNSNSTLRQVLDSVWKS
jgi:uncharacterized protein YjbI with pentapeptide repeats